MNTIRILNEDVASKIAAGEVIERPASIVRELLDNSIDAHADRITVRIEKGGKALVRVADNGVGMSRDDLLLCIERHATSKIREVSDLFSIATLGFRGEALPSIAAVSRVEITSRPADHLVGHRLSIAGGRIRSLDETGSPPGTIVEVRDLFFNLPVRRKFLRAVRTETDLIQDVFSRISLPFLRIHFRLETRDGILMNLPASEDLRNRLSVILGRDTASALVQEETESGSFRLNLYLAPPDHARSRADRILLYVNNRPVKDKLVTRAVIEGYGQRLMKGRYPQVVLFLEIDPFRIDINIHPAKQEIRFRDAQALFRTMVSMIEQAMKRHFAIPIPDASPDPWAPSPFSVDRPLVTEAGGEYRIGKQDLQSEPPEALDHQQDLVEEGPRIIGQLKNTYIICQTQEGLLLVDQHAAHERILYERLRRRFDEARPETQFFLIPQQWEVSIADKEVLLGKLEQLSRLGFDIEHFGGETFLVRSVPPVLLDLNWKPFLVDILPVLREEKDVTRGRALDRLITVMACHGAIRAGKSLTIQEMQTLLNELRKTDLPAHCPHGRPVFKEFRYPEIERMFKRIPT
ncbi:MAG: DNA mismatch repair endonuclease MutL [Deltaproteobacteria bacterium]|nr:DNA mismatch repair endonuclease MutL [Deltaproteobacteria bacterium]